MKYWEDFQTKFGFNDGVGVPPDAKACRYVYVMAINSLAKRNKSKVRLIAYDRPGMHNCYLILCVDAKHVGRVPAKKLATGELKFNPAWPVAAYDKSMQDAINKSMTADLDLFVYTRVVNTYD